LKREVVYVSNSLDQAAVFDKWLSGAPDVWLECKANTHDWSNRSLKRDGAVFVEWAPCQRGCGVERTREYSARTGCPVGTPHYRYPEGYVTVGAGLLDTARRGVIRLSYFASRVGGTE
jgi:hypothetical protein